MSKWICSLRLHWLFDHGVSFNALKDVWTCKRCGHVVKTWCRPHPTANGRGEIDGEEADDDFSPADDG